MKKFRLAFCALIFMLLIVPVIAELQQDSDLQASLVERKNTINQYEKVIVGGNTLTALDNQLKFLSDNPAGALTTWADANTIASNWKTTAGFSTREQAFLTTRLGSKADLPITSNILHTNIPKSSDNWWLTDSTTGEGTPKSFVDKDNGVDSGYTNKKPIIDNNGVCGLEDNQVSGGLNTTDIPAKSTSISGEKRITFTYGTLGTTPTAFRYWREVRSGSLDAECKTPPMNITVLETEVVNPNQKVVLSNEVDPDNQWPLGAYRLYSQGYTFHYEYISPPSTDLVQWCIVPKDPTVIMGNPTGASGQYNVVNVTEGTKVCNGVITPSSLALTRPVVTIQSSIFSALTAPSTSTSSDGALGNYPDAGVGPYTLQVVENGLKVILDSSDTNVSGNVIKHRDDGIQDGKITISYDISGSSYESDSEVFISAISGGKYAKLGSAVKNGKGSVVLDINNLVTKNDGWIGPQDISVELYQEEITPSGKTNYISTPHAITISILPGKVEQTPIVISNGDTVNYGDNGNKFNITTTGGSGEGAMSYELVSGSEFASITGSEITVKKPGKIRVKASKASDEVYKASSNEKEITIQKAMQNFSITTTEFTIKKDVTSFQIETSARVPELTSALTYVLNNDGNGAATMNANGLVSVIKAGTINVTVRSTGNVNYLDGEDTKDIVITDLPAQAPALTINNSDTRAYGDTNNQFVVSTLGGQGSGAITYRIIAGSDVASVDQASKTVTVSKVGKFTLEASKSGGSNYLDSVATLEITVTKAKQEAFQITNLGTYLIDTNPTIQVTTNMKPENVLGKLTYTLTGEAFASIDTNGLITTKDEGTFTVRVTSPGNEFYEDAVSDVKTIVLTKRVAQNPLVLTPPGKLEYSKNLQFQAITSGGQGTGATTYSITTGLNSVATVNPSTGEIAVLKPGTFTLNATKAADTTYLESVASPIDIVVDKIAQDNFAITTTGFVMKEGSTSFQVETTPRVGDISTALVYALVNDGGGVATMDMSGLITVKKTGTIQVRVTSPGDDYYASGEDTKEIVISQLPMQEPALSIRNKTSRVYGEDGNKFTIITSGGQGSGAISYAITSGSDVASVNAVERSVSISKVGSFTLQATQAGDGQYQDSIASINITVTKAPQDSFIITNEDFQLKPGATFEIATNGRSGELTTPLVYDLGIGKGDVATISGNVITPLKVGELELIVTSMGNENYSTKEAKKTIQITDLPEQPTLRITNSKNLTYNPANNILSIITEGGASDAGAITYSIEPSSSFAQVDDPSVGNVTIIKPGTFTVMAIKDGAGKYKNAVATSEITVNKMSQDNLAISNVDVIMDTTKTFPITVSGLPVDLVENISYDITGKGDIANISNNMITPLKAGTITISITSYGNDFYEDKSISKSIKISELPLQTPGLSILNGDTMIYNPSKPTFKMLTDGGQGDGAVTYEISDGKGIVANIDRDIVNILKPGSFRVIARKDGGGTYKDSVVEKVILVNKAVQSDFKITNTSFMITDVANSFDLVDSGRPLELTTALTYDIVEDLDGIATIVGKRIQVSKPGTIKVSALSTGNDNYEDKTVMATIVITELPDQAPLQISNASALKFGDNNNHFTLTTTGGSSESDVVYGLKSGSDVVDLNGSNILVKKVGTFTITASKSGNGTHKDVEVDKTFTVSKGKQKDFMITNTDVQLKTDLTIEITVSGRPSGLSTQMVYTLASEDVATLSGNVITPFKTGTIEIQVQSPGNDNYDSAYATKTIAITSLPVQDPVLVINNVPTRVFDYDMNIFDISASGGSDDAGEMSYDILAGKDSIASISGKKVTVLKPGKFTIQAKRNGNNIYQDSIATKEITVSKMVQSNFVITNKDFTIGSAETFTIETDGLPQDVNFTPNVSYALSEGHAFATLNGNVVTPIKEGTIVVEVTSKGNDFYRDEVEMKSINIKKLPLQSAFKITNAKTMTYNPSITSFEIVTQGGASDAGAITYEVVSGQEFVTIQDETKATVSILKPGNFTLKANKDGAGKYQDIEATIDVVFEKAIQSDFRITNSNFIIKKDANTFKITTGGRIGSLEAPLTYAITNDDASIASIRGDTVEVQGAGAIRVSATSLGNDFYKDITVEKVITIQTLPVQEPALQISNDETIPYDEESKAFNLILSGGEGSGGVSYAITAGNDVASVDSGVVSYQKVGTFTIEATKSGGDVYQDSVASKTFTITPGEQKNFAITNTDFIFNSSPTFALTTSGKASEVSGDVSFEMIVGEGTVASLLGSIVTPITTGSIEVRATSPASANYLEKVVTKSIQICNLPNQSPVVSISNEDMTWGDQGNRMNVTYDGGQGNGATSYNIVAGNDVASIEGNVVTIHKTGTFHIHVKKSGNGIYSDSEDTKEIVVSKKDIRITPNPIRKNVGQVWASVQTAGYEVSPALVQGDVLLGTPIYAYGNGVDDTSPAGSYKTVLSGLSNEHYNIQFMEGDLQVEKAILSPASAYFKVLSGTLGNNGWYTSDVVLTSLQKDGYTQLSDSSTFTGSDVMLHTEGENVLDLLLKNINGTISEPIPYELKIDKTKPMMEDMVLTKKNSSAFKKFMNTLTLGHWFQQEIEVAFVASDNLNGAITYQYQEEIDGVVGEWKTTTSDKIFYGEGANVKVHVKAVDEAGNESNDTIVSDLIQIDLSDPIVEGVVSNQSYYLPRYVIVSDILSQVDMNASYSVHKEVQRALAKETLFNEINDITLHVQDHAGNVLEVSFGIRGLPPLQSITDSDESRKIVSDVEAEYAQIKDKLTDPLQRQEIEDWIQNAKDSSKKFVAKVEEPKTGIIVDGGDDVIFEEGVELIVEVVTTIIKDENIVLDNVSGIDEKDEIKEVYDIYLKKDDIRVQPSGLVTVKIPYTEKLKSYENIKVLYIDDNQVATVYPSKIEEEYITFQTTHFSYYAIVGKKSALNVDSDDDKLPDLNIDIDNDGTPDLNVDVDDDGVPDVNIDSDFDGKADLNIDVNDDGVADVNVIVPQKDWKPNVCGEFHKIKYCTSNELKAYINIDTDHDGRPDINIDWNNDLEPELNIDTGDDRIPDTDIDNNGDGKADVNIDINGDGIGDEHIVGSLSSWNPSKDCTYNGFAYDTDASIVWIVDTPQGGNGSNNGSSGNGSYQKPSTGGANDGIVSAPTGDETDWGRWWTLLGTSLLLMLGTSVVKKCLKKNEKVKS